MKASPDNPTPSLFTDFRVFLAREQAALTAGVVAACVAQGVIPAGETRENTEKRTSEAITAYLRALEDPTVLTAWITKRVAEWNQAFTPVVGVQILRVYRQQFLDAALRAVEQGVAHAAAGTRALIGFIDTVEQQSIESYQEQLDLFKMLIDRAPDGIAIANADTAVIYANDTFRAMSGYADNTLGMSFMDMYSPEVQQYISQEAPQALETTGYWDSELQAQRPDNTEWTAQVRSFILADGSDVRGQVAFFRDITTQRDQEDQLRTANARLERFFEATPLSTISWDHDGLIRRWNPSAERIFGWSAEEAYGKNIFELLVPEIAKEQVREVIDALLGGQVTNSRNVNITKDGRIVACQWYNTVIRDASGNVTEVLSQTEDISDQIEREQALRNSNNRLQAVITNLSVVVFSFNTEGVFTYSDGKGLEQMDLKSGQVVGLSVYDVYRDFPNIIADIERALAGETFVVLRTIAGRLFETRYAPLTDDQNSFIGTVGIAIDITERKEAEEERLRLQEEIINAQQAALRELSTPLIPLADGIVAMPLIGNVDDIRAQQVIEDLLTGVAHHRAETVILDITGVPVVDTQVANALVQAAQAVQLLGAQVMLTGIRPEVAQTLVGLGVNLGNIVTQSTLQSGIAAALRSRGR